MTWVCRYVILADSLIGGLKMIAFKLNRDYSVMCESQGTRMGFRHIAIIMVKGYELGRVKCTYQNRTWESYRFQLVLQKALDYPELKKRLSKNLLTRFRKKVKNRGGF